MQSPLLHQISKAYAIPLLQVVDLISLTEALCCYWEERQFILSIFLSFFFFTPSLSIPVKQLEKLLQVTIMPMSRQYRAT